MEIILVNHRRVNKMLRVNNHLTTEGAASYLNVSQARVRKLIKDGRLSAEKRGRDHLSIIGVLPVDEAHDDRGILRRERELISARPERADVDALRSTEIARRFLQRARGNDEFRRAAVFETAR